MFRLRSFVPLFCICLAFCLPDSKNYTYIRFPQKLVTAEFDRPDLSFPLLSNSDFETKVQGGRLHILNKSQTPGVLASLINLTYQGDFEVSAVLSVIRKDTWEGIGGFGLYSEEDGIDVKILLTNPNSCIVSSNLGGNILNIFRENKASNFREVVFRKIGNTLYFFCEQNFVGSLNMKPYQQLSYVLYWGTSDSIVLENFSIKKYYN